MAKIGSITFDNTKYSAPINKDKIAAEKKRKQEIANAVWESSRKKQEEDKYYFGKYTEKAANTIADLGLDVAEGGLGYLEGVTDWASYRIADVSELFGGDSLAEDLRKNADFASTATLFGKNQNAGENIFGNWTAGIEEKSWSPEFVDQIFSGVGQVGMAAATAYLTGGSVAATAGVTYASSYGNARSEAKRSGLSDREANRVGVIHGIAETISENLFEGAAHLPVFKGGIGSNLGKKINGKITDSVAKYFGSNAGKITYKILGNVSEGLGEGTEEIISNILVAVGNDTMHYIDNNFDYGMEGQSGNIFEDAWAQVTSGDSWNQFFSAAMTSAIVGGGRAIIDTATQNKIINAYAKDNGMSFQDAKYILTGQLESAKQEIKQDKIKFNSQVELEEMAKQRVLNYMKAYKGKNIEAEIDKQADLEINNLEQQNGERIPDDIRLNIKQNIRAEYENQINSPQRYQNFALEKEPTDVSQKELYNDFQQKTNNTQEAHGLYELMTTLQKQNTNAQYGLVNNEDLVNMGLLEKQTDANGKTIYGRTITQDGKTIFKEETINGLNLGDRILINADGVNAFEATIWHEIGHTIKDADPTGYNELKRIVNEVYGANDLKAYKELYGDIPNLEDEYINDKLGEMLNNEKFINRISQNRNVFERIIDEIKRLVKRLTASDEKKKLMDLQERLEKRYIELYKAAKFENKGKVDFMLRNELNYATQRAIIKDAKQYFKNSGNTELNEFELSKAAQKYQEETGVAPTDYVETIKDYVKENGYKSFAEVDEFNGIWYNKNGIEITDKQEYGTMSSAIKAKQSENLDYRGLNVANNYDYYYVFKDDGFDNFKPIMKIENNESNKAIIDGIKEVLQNETYTDTKRLNNIAESIFERHGFNNSNNVDVENRGTTNINDEIFITEQGSNQNRDIGGSNQNIRDVENTSFNLPKYSLAHAQKIENNDDIQKIDAQPSPYQTMRPKVRNGWNLDKIQKQLKNESSNRVNSKDIAAFDNLDDIMDNVFYHGSTSAHDNLKAGSTLPEQYRTGGYGEEYHTISLSGSKNTASNFSSMGQNGVVMPVILKKDAKVIEMPNIEDSIELEDYLPQLWDKGIDAVKIGDWDVETKGYGEQELVVLNPRAIMTLPEGNTYYQNYHKPKFANMTKEEVRDALNKRFEKALNDPKNSREIIQRLKENYGKILNETNLPTEQNTKSNEGEIQGLENYTQQEVKDITNNYINEKLQENGYFPEDIKIVDSAIHGSRNRGTAKANSDLDVVVQYDGDIREDDLFNILNGNGKDNLYIDGIKVDINPIQENLNDYMVRSNAYDQEVLNKNNARYSLSVKETNTGVDNNGNKLSKSQREYFKDSKATDENGNLIKVYHTTTDEVAQFNEFNPVGTQYYRFGDQVVNYYTDSKDMSGSYASQDYIEADTTRIKNLPELNNYLHNEAIRTGNVFNVEKSADGKYTLSQESEIGKEAKEFVNSLNENQIQQMRENIYEADDELAGTNYARAFEWDKFDKQLQEKFNKALEKYMGTADLVAMQQQMMKYLENPSLMVENNASTATEIVKTYNSKEEMFRNIKQDIQNSNWSKNSKLQYQGYVNITNPYVIDAEKRNWNQVVQQSNDFIDELQERVPEDIKNNLTRLYRESENMSADARDTYNNLEQIIHGIWNSALDENIKKVNEVVKDVGFNEVELMLDGGSPGVSAWYNVADSLERNGLIGGATKSFIIDEFRLPEQVKNLIEENYNKEFGIHQLQQPDVMKTMKQLGRTTTLKSIYNENQKNYDTFEKYRYPNTYFLEQISAEGNDYLGYDLEDMFETRAEIYGADQVGEEIAQAASVAFSKPELIRLWGTSKTTNDIVKEIIASNKDGTTNYDGVIITNVYDYGGRSATGTQANNLYVTFNSNQFKAADNLKPTQDADIRYQLADRALERGYGTYTEDITNNRPVRGTPNLPTAQSIETNVEQENLPTQVEQNEELPFYEAEAEDRMAERRRKLADDRISKMLEKQTFKSVKEATKMAKSYLGFNQQETERFKKQINKLAAMPKDNLIKSKNYNKLRDIIKQYSSKDMTFVNQEIKEVQKEIRHTPLIVSQNLKNQITDWSAFKKSSGLDLYMGDKSNVDTKYQEFLDSYPGMLDSSLTNYADQLQELSEFLKRDTKYVEHFDLSEDTINQITNKVWEKISNNALTIQEIDNIQNEINQQVERRTREVVQNDLLNQMGITIEDIAKGKDINALAYQRTDPVRVNEKVFGVDTGSKINEATTGFVKHQEAERIRFVNQEKAEIKELGIKARSKESAAVQKWGEGQYVNKHGEVVEYNDHNLAAEFPDVRTQEKIKNAANVLRSKYDNYIERINESLTDMGYDPIPKRKDYFMHFIELEDKLSQWGLPFSRENLGAEDLPTDINGLTDQFKPGKNFFASAMERKGVKTTYDAITGIDKYLDGASNLMYHTESIQRYRTLSKLIRNTYGQTHGLENLDMMTPEEAQQRVNDVYDNKLTKYAAWLDEQANALAGKKGGIDRAAERFLGRKVYTLLGDVKKQVGSNMTGFNVRSSLTNFASAIQGAAKTQKLAALKGFAFALRNYNNIDPLVAKSDFLATRFGTEQLSRKAWQKISNAGQVFMNASDRFTSLQIWGGKYYEGLQNGLSEAAAIKQADNFAARIMGDRSKGQTAEMFNSKTLGLFTQFQLEVNNQWSSMIHDNKMAMKQNPGAKTALHVANQLGQLYAASWFFNNFMKAVTGSDVMFDPIDILMGIFNPDDDDEDLEERSTKALGKIIDQLPMASVFTGGRIPMSEAFTGIGTLTKKITGQKDSFGAEYTWEDVKDDLIASSFYYLFPTGFGQVKKTAQGLGMYGKVLPTTVENALDIYHNENLPLAGVYTKTGRFKYEADTSPFGVAQAALFGRNASANAREYREKGWTALTEKQTQTAVDANLPISEYREIKDGIKEQEGNSNKIDYIYNLPLNANQKNVLANSILNRKNDVDLTNYGDYASLEEFDYANKNPDKYATIKQITDYDSYNTYKDDIASIKEQYTTTEERKQAVFNYINRLNLNKYQKLMLQKMAGGYSIKNYQSEMFAYINRQNLTKKEKETIYKELFK